MRREKQTAEHTPRRRTNKKAAGIVFTIYILLVILAVFVIDGRHPSFTVNGDKDMTLEVGEEYTELGAEATSVGRIFKNDGQPLEVSITGDVDTSKVGEYKVVYHAKALFIPGSAVRHVSVVDTVAPVIELQHNAEQAAVSSMADYVEEGYTASDNYDGDITDRVVRSEEYGKIIYAVTDSSGNPGYAEREVPYYDPIPPEITLEGGADMAITTGTFYQEPGYTAVDNVDGDLTGQVQVDGEVDWLTPGTYSVTYTVTDGYENTTTATRTVEVKAVPRPEVVWPEGKVIYLTFDDGPGPYTEQLLDVLDSYGVKATFFVTNRGYGEMMKEIVDRGHSIGIHTMSHVYERIYASPEAYFADLLGMQDVIYRNTGVKTTLMRFPGGSSNTVSAHSYVGLMSLLTRAVQDAGFQYFDWNVDSNDAGGAKKAQTVFNNVTAGVSQNRVSVVLQHDIHDFSVDAVEDIIVWGLNNGYSFERLTENSPGVHHGVQN